MIVRLLICLLFVNSFGKPLSAASTVNPSERIISLTPAITEMLFALGLGPHVVGESLYSNYPPAAKAITKIGGIVVDYEQVVALRPTLVVSDALATPEADTRLTHLHLPLLVIRPTTIDSVEQSLTEIGAATGTSQQASVLVAKMQAQRLAAQRLVARCGARPRVLLVVATNPLYVAGQHTFMNDLLLEAGGLNAAGLTGYSVLSKEVLLAHPPDFILADPEDQEAVRADPVLSMLPPVRLNKFIYIPSDLIDRPGPRITQGLLLLARALASRLK